MYRERLTTDELDVLLTSHRVLPEVPAPADLALRETDTQMDEALADLHARFADELAAALTGLARSEVVVKLRDTGRGRVATP